MSNLFSFEGPDDWPEPDDFDFVDYPSEWNVHNIPPQNKRHKKIKEEKADGNQCGMSNLRGFTKRLKNRSERRRAKINPECDPGYGRYRGWLT